MKNAKQLQVTNVIMSIIELPIIRTEKVDFENWFIFDQKLPLISICVTLDGMIEVYAKSDVGQDKLQQVLDIVAPRENDDLFFSFDGEKAVDTIHMLEVMIKNLESLSN